MFSVLFSFFVLFVLSQVWIYWQMEKRKTVQVLIRTYTQVLLCEGLGPHTPSAFKRASWAFSKHQTKSVQPGAFIFSPNLCTTEPNWFTLSLNGHNHSTWGTIWTLPNNCNISQSADISLVPLKMPFVETLGYTFPDSKPAATVQHCLNLGKAYRCAVCVWNSLPQDLRHCSTLSSFQAKLKTFLF